MLLRLHMVSSIFLFVGLMLWTTLYLGGNLDNNFLFNIFFSSLIASLFTNLLMDIFEYKMSHGNYLMHGILTSPVINFISGYFIGSILTIFSSKTIPIAYGIGFTLVSIHHLFMDSLTCQGIYLLRNWYSLSTRSQDDFQLNFIGSMIPLSIFLFAVIIGILTK